MAVIKAFEFTYELGWKTLKDYLNYQGIAVSLPREVIKQAYANQLIDNGQGWIDMLETRNILLQVDGSIQTNQAVQDIQQRYGSLLEQLIATLSASATK